MDGSPCSIPRRWQLAPLPARRALVEFLRPRPSVGGCEAGPAGGLGSPAECVGLSSAPGTVRVIRVQGIDALSEKLNSAEVGSSGPSPASDPGVTFR